MPDLENEREPKKAGKVSYEKWLETHPQGTFAAYFGEAIENDNRSYESKELNGRMVRLFDTFRTDVPFTAQEISEAKSALAKETPKYRTDLGASHMSILEVVPGSEIEFDKMYLRLIEDGLFKILKINGQGELELQSEIKGALKRRIEASNPGITEEEVNRYLKMAATKLYNSLSNALAANMLEIASGATNNSADDNAGYVSMMISRHMQSLFLNNIDKLNQVSEILYNQEEKTFRIANEAINVLMNLRAQVNSELHAMYQDEKRKNSRMTIEKLSEKNPTFANLIIWSKKLNALAEGVFDIYKGEQGRNVQLVGEKMEAIKKEVGEVKNELEKEIKATGVSVEIMKVLNKLFGAFKETVAKLSLLERVKEPHSRFDAAPSREQVANERRRGGVRYNKDQVAEALKNEGDLPSDTYSRRAPSR